MKKSSSYKTKEKSSSANRNRKKEKREIKEYMKKSLFKRQFRKNSDFGADERT